MNSYVEMLQQFNRLKQEIESARTREMRRFLGELIDLLDRNGISLSDLIEYRAATGHRVRPAIPPKYMDPATGRTWTGRGREPQWIRGKDRSVFLIDRDDERAP